MGNWDKYIDRYRPQSLKRPDLKQQIKEGFKEALDEWQPKGEPEKFDALDPQVSAAEMERQYPGVPGVFRDRDRKSVV